MKKLRKTYGYCIIPKNTFLYRGHNAESVTDCMFFTTKHWVAGAFNKSIQVWKTKKDIKVLFLVDHINHHSWTSSALPQLYKTLFPNDKNINLNYLDIKRMPTGRRNKLVRKLFDEYQISGWLTSLENKVELEVCLFDKQANKNQLKLWDTTGAENKNYFKDSLDRIKIFPGKMFYEKTKQVLVKPINYKSENIGDYKNYKKAVDAWIKEEVKNGMKKKEAKHLLLNLRIKLKI